MEQRTLQKRHERIIIYQNGGIPTLTITEHVDGIGVCERCLFSLKLTATLTERNNKQVMAKGGAS